MDTLKIYLHLNKFYFTAKLAYLMKYGLFIEMLYLVI